MATLQDAIEHIAHVIGGIDGIRSAPAYPEEQLNVFPFAVVYPGEGEASISAGVRLNLDTIIVELHVARKDLPRDVEKALPYVDSIPNEILDEVHTYWGRTIDTIESITWTFGALNWGGQETLGFRFTINGIKRRVNIT